jgi:hypothetical protein
MHRSPHLAAVLAACATLILATRLSAATPDFALWADSSNGLPAVDINIKAIPRPRLLADSTRHLLYFTGSGTWTAGVGWGGLDDGIAFRVWRASLPAGQFELMPHSGAGKLAVYDMTLNTDGELVVAGADLGTGRGEVYRFDEATQQWRLSTYLGGASSPTLTMRAIRTAPDGTIWGGGQWFGLYRSTDGGRTFSVTNTGLPQTLLPAAFFPSAHGSDNVGAIFSLDIAADGTLYAGTETSGVIHSTNGGASWDSIDPSYHGVYPPSLMDLGYLGNVMTLGVRNDGTLLANGYADPGAPSGDWPTIGQALYHFDPAIGTDVVADSAPAFPPFFWNNQRSFRRFVTTANGASFFSMDRYPDLDFAGAGGVYRSEDGSHWQPMNSGLVFPLFGSAPYRYTNSEGGIEVSGNTVYVATADAKIFRHDEAGASDEIFPDGFDGPVAP